MMEAASLRLLLLCTFAACIVRAPPAAPDHDSRCATLLMPHSICFWRHIARHANRTCVSQIARRASFDDCIDRVEFDQEGTRSTLSIAVAHVGVDCWPSPTCSTQVGHSES